MLEAILEKQEIEELHELLKQCGYSNEEGKKADESLLFFIVKDKKQEILNITHQKEFPSELVHIILRRAIGQFFYTKLQTNQLNLGENIDLGGIMTSIKEGDTSVSFAQGFSDLEKLNTFIDSLLHCGEREILCFRKIKWY